MGPKYQPELDEVNQLMHKGFNHRFDMYFDIDYNQDFRQIVRQLKKDVYDLGTDIVISRKNKGTMMAKNVPQPVRLFILKYIPGIMTNEINV